MNAGNAVWGMLGAGLLFYFLIGLIIFLFLWPVTQDIMLSFLAWCIGIGGKGTAVSFIAPCDYCFLQMLLVRRPSDCHVENAFEHGIPKDTVSFVLSCSPQRRQSYVSGLGMLVHCAWWFHLD